MRNPHCPNGHCKALRLPDGASGTTPGGACRRCVRLRQVRYMHTAKGQRNRDRHEATSRRVLKRIRYIREAGLASIDLGE